MATGEVVYVRDTRAEPNFRIIDPDVRSILAVPLTVHDQVIGTLSIDSISPNAFSPEHERLLTIAGSQLAAAIEMLRLLEETRQRAAQLAEAKATDLLVPQVVYGYFAANAEGDDLVIWKDESRTSEWMRFTYPRQPKEPFLCIADFFRPISSGETDYAAFHIVTMGSKVSERTAELFAENRFEGKATDIITTVGAHLVTDPFDDGQALILEAFVAARLSPISTITRSSGAPDSPSWMRPLTEPEARLRVSGTRNGIV